ncbi:hypothetical protein MRB53_020386 [Persea americana]|uniref:Uncharacterized protein n=1 Tax=Persea americana TaxID=3435 RepID=A0ACC2L0V0_PERAE|nr:hypothetical protein MRB53_020386 [Persea americana]
MARGMLEKSYQLVSEQFDPNMEDNTFGAQMVEKMCSLQTSQVILKETYEHHGKLLTEILWRLENLQATQNSAEKNSQAGPFIETLDVEYQTYRKRPWYEQEGSNNDGDASPKDAKQNRLSPEAKADGDWLRRGKGALAICIRDKVTSETPADEVVAPMVIKEKVLSLLALETDGECISIIGHGLNRVYVKMSRASDDELQMMNQNFRILVQMAFSKVSRSLFVAMVKLS